MQASTPVDTSRPSRDAVSQELDTLSHHVSGIRGVLAGGNPNAEIVKGFSEVGWAAGRVEGVFLGPCHAPVIFAAMGFVPLIVGRGGAAIWKVGLHSPSRVVQRRDADAVAVLPVTVTVADVARLQPSTHVWPIGVYPTLGLTG
jgi:hypothetical protein